MMSFRSNCSLCILAACSAFRCAFAFRCFNLQVGGSLLAYQTYLFVSILLQSATRFGHLSISRIFTPVRLNLVRRLSHKLFKCSLLSFFHCSWICTSRWSFNLICNANLSCSYDSRNRSSTSTNTWNLHPIDKVHSPIEGVVLVKGSSNQQIVFYSVDFLCSVAIECFFAARRSS